MELFSAAWLSALLAIVLIDLVLAGDNAIVIALAARRLPAHLQKRAIVWGTVGAIVVRSLMTIALSPARTRSIRTMASRADSQAAENSSINAP